VTPLEDVEYVYTQADGKPLIKKIRYYKYVDGQMKKTFRLEGIKRDQWVSGIEHLNGQRETLYNLPAILKYKASRTIYIVNGEKAADRMAKEKLIATCQPFGEGGSALEAKGKWKPRHILTGAIHVVIVADLDDVGEAYAGFVASQIQGKALKVEIVQSATGKARDDAYDHFESGFKVSDFVQRKDLLPARGLPRRSFGAVFNPIELEHLVYPYLPKGKCILLDADGGIGKSTLCLAWAASLSRGIHPTKFTTLEAPIRTLYLHKGEDTDEELETVYRANGGLEGFLEFAGADLEFDSAGLRLVQETIEDGKFGLVVVDALFYFIDQVVKDSAVAMDVVGVIAGLNKVAFETGASFLNVRHTTKGHMNKLASELGMGSVQFRNSHRGQLVARFHPDKRGVVVVTDEKGSILNPRGEHFCFLKVGAELQYLHGIEDPFSNGSVSPECKTKLTNAERIITDMLTGEWVPVHQIFLACKELGINKRTVETAKAKLAIRYRRGGPEGPVYATIPVEDPFAD
jgi:hypothetical protein